MSTSQMSTSREMSNFSESCQALKTFSHMHQMFPWRRGNELSAPPLYTAVRSSKFHSIDLTSLSLLLFLGRRQRQEINTLPKYFVRVERAISESRRDDYRT